MDAEGAASLVRVALSDAGVPIEEISRRVGHAGTTVTELVYRHQIRPVVQGGALVMDELFGQADSRGVDAQLDAQGPVEPGDEGRKSMRDVR